METYVILLQSIMEFEFQVDALSPTDALDKFKLKEARQTGNLEGDLVRDYQIKVVPFNNAESKALENYYWDVQAR
jgi:hypothetical protein